MRARVLAPCLAILTTLLSSTVAGAVPARAQPASGTICVALVVDFSTLGGTVQSGCETVPKGSTGADVLEAAGHRLTICSDGIIGAVDGRPADGCQTKDSTHYWSYWHRAPGGSHWVYSSEGAGSYEPADASTEGWIWQDGGSHNRAPADVPYDDICRPSPSPSPSPAATAHHARTRPQHGTAGAPSAPPPTPAGSTAATAEPAQRPSGRTGGDRREASRRAAANAAPAVRPPATASPSPSPDATTASPLAGRAVASQGAERGGGPPWSAVAGAVAVLLVGAAAVRRRRAP